MKAGDNLLIQMLNEGIYEDVAGVTYIDIFTAYSDVPGYSPEAVDYKQKNIIVSMRQKVLIDETRIEVVFDEDS